MQRILVSVGTWASIVFVAGLCLATDPRRPGNQPAAPASPQPAASGGAGGGFRYAAPSHNGGSNASAYQRAAEARRAAQAAAAAANVQRNSNNYYSSSGYSPYGYSPYGYSPYGYPYSPYGYYPPGTNPYVLGYDPSTGAMFLYPYGGGYSSYYPPSSYPYAYPNRYSYYRNPYLGYGYPSAVFANAGQLYGLGPIQQLMGVSQWFQPPANANGLANGNAHANDNANGNAGNANPGLANNGNAARQDADPPARKPAAGGGMALEIAWKFITFGDAHFGNQKYNDALDRYRRAARECPTLADAWFREGFALAALGRYDQAAKAMRRGLEEKPDWVDSNFRLSELYGDNGDDKKTLLDKMIKASEAEPTNADLAYVVGVHLYCDGRVDQSAPFFHRAAQILNSDADVKPFLAKGQ